MNNNGPIRAGIAGLGRSGWNLHALPMNDLAPKYKVVAVTDNDPQRRKEAVEKFGCREHASFESLLADNEVELLVVATPSQLHVQHSIAALKAGRHVVSEKPAARSSAELQTVINAAKAAGKIYAPYQNRRYELVFQKIRQVVQSGELGRIVEIRLSLQSFSRRWDWQTLREFDGGQLNNTGPHFIDQSLVLFGEKEPQVFCRMDRALASGDAEDHVKVILYAKDAPLVDLEITAASAYKQDIWQIMGTTGGLRSDLSSVQWKTVDFSKMPPRPVDRAPTAGRAYNSEAYEWTEHSWAPAPNQPSICHFFYTAFYETLRHGKPLDIPPEFVQRQIRIIEECHRQGGY